MKTLICLCLGFFFAAACSAETFVKFKDGKTASGKLLEETADYVKLDVQGIELTYWKDEIASYDTAGAAPAGQAPSGTDSEEIQKTIEAYLAKIETGDPDAALNYVSKNFLFTSEDNQSVNYEEFKESLTSRVNGLKKRKSAVKIRGLSLDALSIDTQKNSATAIARFEQETNIPAAATRTIREMKQKVALAKEDGVWKITAWPSRKPQTIQQAGTPGARQKGGQGQRAGQRRPGNRPQ